MKVLQILPELQSGGVERGTVELASHLADQGHQSLVVSNGGDMVSELDHNNSLHITLPVHRKSLLSLLVVPKLHKLLSQEQPDILHVRSRVPAWLAWLAWKRLPTATRPRLVSTVHGFYSVNRYSSIMTRGERVICVSESIRHYVQKNYPQVNEKALRVIHRGIDPERYHPDYTPDEAWQRQWYLAYPQTLGRRLLVLAGRITPLKGQLEFIELFRRLQTQEKNLHGLIVGSTHPRRQAYAESLHQRVSELGLTESITFTGNRNDLREIFAISDLVFSLSRQPESFGRTVLEPLALGVPVIGFDDGGVGEILREMFPQGIVERDHHERLPETTRQVLHTPLKPKKSHPFLLGRMLSETEALYNELLASAR